MKNRLLIIFSFIILLSCSDNEMPKISPLEIGTFEDSRDGNIYEWVRFSGLEWMTSNLKAEATTGTFSTYYKDAEIGGGSISEGYYETYGYLYDFEAANNVCPEGWRLPSDSDWKSLEKALGMKEKDLDKTDFRGSYEGELLKQYNEGTRMALRTGGFYSIYSQNFNTEYYYYGVYGYYWTSTVENDDELNNFAYYRKIAYNRDDISRDVTMRNNQLNIRCVRDAN